MDMVQEEEDHCQTTEERTSFGSFIVNLFGPSTHMVPLYGQEPVGTCFWIILLRIEQIVLTKQHLKM